MLWHLAQPLGAQLYYILAVSLGKFLNISGSEFPHLKMAIIILSTLQCSYED